MKHRVPVAIYSDLSRAEEAKLFIDINTNQRGVPAALLLDIKQLAEIEGAKESRLRILFDRLGSDPKSALSGKLSPAKSAPHRISRVAFNRAVGGALNSEIIRPLQAEDLFKLIQNYVSAFEAELIDKSLLTKSAYFEAIFEIFDEVVRATMANSGNVKQASIQEAIRGIAKMDYSGQGRLTKRGYTDQMQAAFRKSVALSADLL